MVNLFSSSGKVAYGIQNFVLDYESDVAKLPTNKAVGSSAYVLESGNTYYINSNKEWKRGVGAPSNGGGSSTDDIDTYVSSAYISEETGDLVLGYNDGTQALTVDMGELPVAEDVETLRQEIEDNKMTEVDESFIDDLFNEGFN